MSKNGDDELLMGSQTLTGKEAPDTDGDGVSDAEEELVGTNPREADAELIRREDGDPRNGLERDGLERESTFDPAAEMPEGTTIDTGLGGTGLPSGPDRDLGFGDVGGTGLSVERDPVSGGGSGPSVPGTAAPEFGDRAPDWDLVSDEQELFDVNVPVAPDPGPPPTEPESPEPPDPGPPPPEPDLGPDDQTDPDADGGGSSGPLDGGRSSDPFLGSSPVTNPGRGDLGGGDITGEIRPGSGVGPDVDPDAGAGVSGIDVGDGGTPSINPGNIDFIDTSGPSAPPTTGGRSGDSTLAASGPGTQTEDEIYIGVPQGGSTVASSGGDDDDLDELEVQRHTGPVDQQLDQQMDGAAVLGGVDFQQPEIDAGLAPEEGIEDDPGAFGAPLDDGFD